MAQTKRSSRRRRELSPVHPNAAAIDIGATMHVAAVGPDRDPEPVRTFGTFTGDLHRLADWFEQCGVKTVAMESTGVYWIPVFEILEQRGFEVLLVNARDAKHVPGRKTDVSDAQWLQRLHEYGLLRGSFRPQGRDRGVAGLSAPARAAAGLRGGPHPAHAEGADADEPAAPSRRVGHHGGDRHAHHPRHRGRRARSRTCWPPIATGAATPSVETIRQALTGNDREEHIFALAQALELYDIYQAKVADCDERIEAVLKRLKEASAKPAGKLPPARTQEPAAERPGLRRPRGASRACSGST